MPCRRIWSEMQDKTLKFLRQDLNIQRWSLIAQKLQHDYGIIGRNQKQCRQRYHNHLDSSLTLGKLSEQEEKQLFQLHSRLGNKWSEIAQHFQGRTDASLKNIFHSKLRKGLRKLNRYMKEKLNHQGKIYPLSLVCRIMQSSNLKGKYQSEICKLQPDFLKDLQTDLVEYAGSSVVCPRFQGWSEKKVCQHLKTMLQKIQDLQTSDQVIQNPQISDESEYMPLKQRKNLDSKTKLTKIRCSIKREKIQSERSSSMSDQNEDLSSSEAKKGQFEAAEVAVLQKKRSFQTQLTQSSVTWIGSKNYSFGQNYVLPEHAQQDEDLKTLLEQVDFKSEMQNLVCEWPEIDYVQYTASQSLPSQELFKKILDEAQQELAMF